MSSALGADALLAAPASRQVVRAEAAARAGALRQRSRARVLVDVHGCQAPEAAAELDNEYEREVRLHQPARQSPQLGGSMRLLVPESSAHLGQGLVLPYPLCLNQKTLPPN